MQQQATSSSSSTTSLAYDGPRSIFTKGKFSSLNDIAEANFYNKNVAPPPEHQIIQHRDFDITRFPPYELLYFVTTYYKQKRLVEIVTITELIIKKYIPQGFFKSNFDIFFIYYHRILSLTQMKKRPPTNFTVNDRDFREMEGLFDKAYKFLQDSKQLSNDEYEHNKYVLELAMGQWYQVDKNREQALKCYSFVLDYAVKKGAKEENMYCRVVCNLVSCFTEMKTDESEALALKCFDSILYIATDENRTMEYANRKSKIIIQAFEQVASILEKRNDIKTIRLYFDIIQNKLTSQSNDPKLNDKKNLNNIFNKYLKGRE
ncbi:hypothetical protein ABK040_003548 [Willaertia magna]